MICRRSFLLSALLALALAGCRESGPGDQGGGRATGAGATASREAATPRTDTVVPYENATQGAIEVRTVVAGSGDWFYALQNGKRVGSSSPPLLNSTLEVPPGSYTVSVNKTQREITVEAGKKTVLWTGALAVEGTPTSAYWYPQQGGKTMLDSNPSLMNTPRSLFPGTYTVYVNASVATGAERVGDAVVTPGETTVLKFNR